MEKQFGQELILKASLIEKQSQEVQENIALMNQEIESLNTLSENLKVLQNSSEKRIIASLGKGVHINANLESKEIFVDVGANVIMKKTHAETQIIIENQIKKLMEARIHLQGKLEIYQKTLQALLDEAEHNNPSEQK